MKNNEIYNIVKINNLALSAITPKILDALLELDEKCELDFESLTLNITIKCLDVKVTSRYYDDCYDNREYISTNILFNNKTAIVLERDEYTCTMCGAKKDLVVHHIDCSGQTDEPNNDVDNLTTLCRRCHINLHKLIDKQNK